MTITRPHIGKGIYTTDDISLLLNLPKAKVNRWLNEYWKGYFWKKDKSKAIDFLSLIEFYIFYQLREREISTRKIKEAHSKLKIISNSEYPFANSNLLTYGKDIKFENTLGIINADNSLQYNIIEVVKPFAKKIDYNSKDIAERFYPAGKNVDIVADPKHKFGSPIIKSTNIEINVLYYFYKSGEKVNTIANLYDLSEKQVNDVIKFYEKGV